MDTRYFGVNFCAEIFLGMDESVSARSKDLVFKMLKMPETPETINLTFTAVHFKRTMVYHQYYS